MPEQEGRYETRRRIKLDENTRGCGGGVHATETRTNPEFEKHPNDWNILSTHLISYAQVIIDVELLGFVYHWGLDVNSLTVIGEHMCFH